jgi:hypothetical protein
MKSLPVNCFILASFKFVSSPNSNVKPLSAALQYPSGSLREIPRTSLCEQSIGLDMVAVQLQGAVSLCPSEGFCGRAVGKSRGVQSCYECATCILVNANVDLVLFARVAKLVVYRLQEADKLIAVLPCPESLIRANVNLVVFFGVEALMKMPDGSICKSSTLDKRRTTLPRQIDQHDCGDG